MSSEGTTEVDDGALESLEAQLRVDAVRVTQEAAWHVVKDRESPASPALELSLVLCGDGRIRELNAAWRGVDASTDVLSFEMDDDEGGGEDEVVEIERKTNDTAGYASGNANGSPPVMLGDVVISVDTARRQAGERGHSLLDECRVLLAHGVLHLLGFDHEEDAEEAREMAAAERAVLQACFGAGEGLIALAGGEAGGQAVAAGTRTTKKRSSSREIKLVCLDMDGTLLDSTSSVLESSVEALTLAMERGVRVMLATGKARPAAMAAIDTVAGLKGSGLVGLASPGIFLQGLQVYGRGGAALQSGCLDMDVARRVLEFAREHGVAVTCFLGDECVAPRITPELEELHYRYYEPYPEERSIDEILAGPSIRKMLMMNDDVARMAALRPGMDDALLGTDAGTMVAVDTMLEVVPRGFNKGTALRTLLRDFEGDGVGIENVMAIGDGANDLEMVEAAGVGVAMGNAVDIVKARADDVVRGHDDGGIYDAIVKYVL